MDAAVPGQRSAPTSTEQFNPHPGAEHQLGCPNCGDTDQLELIEQVELITPAKFYDVGVTMPEIDRDADLTAAQLTPRPRTILGFRCARCRLSVQASDALSRLTRA